MKTHELKVGDIIVAVDGVERDEFANTAELFIKLHKTPGDSVTLDVIRDGKRIEDAAQNLQDEFSQMMKLLALMPARGRRCGRDAGRGAP